MHSPPVRNRVQIEHADDQTTLAPVMSTPPVDTTKHTEDVADAVQSVPARLPAPPRVLLAEDDEDMREMLAGVLRRDGYDVIEARDGFQLLQYLATHTPAAEDAVDLVISDIRMPGKNGLDVLAGLRWADPATPVVLITGFGDLRTHLEAKRLGAAAVLDKPFDLQQLRSVILNLLP
jgi:DNA-binding NtrC family response regulator